MAALSLLMFLFLAASTSLSAAQSRVSKNVTVGFSLSTSTNPNFWPSPSGRFAFGFYPELEGFKVGIWITGIQSITVVWTANRDDSPVSDGATLTLTEEGVILGIPGRNITISGGSFRPVSFASMLDSGNFVLRNSDFDIIWGSFDSPTDTILAGQRLLVGYQLSSGVNETDHSTGRFRLKMQTDGNLVLYPAKTEDSPTHAYWASQSNRKDENVTLKLDPDGNLYLPNSSGSIIKNLALGSSSVNTALIYRATLDVDGIFRLYSHSFGRNGTSNTNVIWYSNSDRCEVKGVCGVDSYCTLNDTEPTCLCPPGFNYVNPNNKFDGCWRGFTEPDCRGKKGNTNFSISTLENIFWINTSNTSLSGVTGEECSQACLEDCYCEVATFKEGWCSRQILPLRYGRRNMTDSVRTFFKVGRDSSINGSSPGTIGEENKKKWPTVVAIVLVTFSLIIFAVSSFRDNTISSGRTSLPLRTTFCKPLIPTFYHRRNRGAIMATGCTKEVIPPVLTSTSEPPSLFDGTTRLYISLSCPYAQRTWIARNYKGLQDKITLVPIDLQDRPAWYKEKVYPANKVPSLEHNNEVKGESLDLLKYIDTHFEGPALIPDDPIKREFAEELLAYTDTFSRIVMTALKKKESAEEDFGATFGYIESTLSKFDDGPFFLGDFSLVDIAYAPFFERYHPLLLDVKNYDLTIGRPKLASWIEALDKIDAYTQTKYDTKALVEIYKTRFLAKP